MPATPARIGYITSDFRRVIAGPDPDTVARYGDAARDTDEPIVTFFDFEADAQIIANERLALLSPSRRMFDLKIAGASHGQALSFATVLPTARVIDEQRGYDRDALVVGIKIDLGRDTTDLTTWG
jgi:hypothetical protein